MASPRTITSRRHPLVLACRQIASGRGERGEILLDGEHLVDEALAAQIRVRAVLVRGADELARRAEAAGAHVHLVTADVMAAASPVRTPSGVVAIAEWQPQPLTDAFRASTALVIALVDVQDPGNVGSVIRSADALGASAVVAAGATADPAGWRALRAAMGSTFRVPVHRADVDALFDAARAHRAPDHAPVRALRVLENAAHVDAIITVSAGLMPIATQSSSEAQIAGDALRPLSGVVRSARLAAVGEILHSAWQR